MDHFARIFDRKFKATLTDNKRAVAKLKREVEKAKRSNQHQVKVEIESLYNGIDFSETLTRAKYEESNTDLFRETLAPVENWRCWNEEI